MLIRLLKVITGSLILGGGIALAILSTHGGDAISVFSQGLANITGLTIGTASICFYVLFFIPAYVIDKKQLGIGTILSPVVCALSLDVLLYLLSGVQVSQEMGYVLVVLGIILIGIGLGLYVHGNLGRSSYDAIVLGCSKKLNKPLWLMKAAGDFILCAVGYLLGGEVGLGPILAVLFVGIILQFTITQLDKFKSL